MDEQQEKRPKLSRSEREAKNNKQKTVEAPEVDIFDPKVASANTQEEVEARPSKSGKAPKKGILPPAFKKWWKRHHMTKGLILAFVFFTLAVSSYLFFLAKTANVSVLKAYMESSTTMYDIDDQKAGEMYGQKGTYVTIDQVSKYVIEAAIATEDKTFYTNPGVNIKRTIFATVTLGRFGGASTITQQLAKNAYLTQKRTIDRKAREIFLALEITKKYSKDDIMMMYLNSSYYGNGIWGIEDASQKYFGKSAKDLRLSEAATLVGTLNWPEVYNPLYKDAKYATERRNIVLQNMVNSKYISKETAAESSAVDMLTQIHDTYQGKDSDYKYPSYFDAVIDEAIRKYGLTEQEILNNGYKIYTNMNTGMQQGLQETYSYTGLFPVAADGTMAQSATIAVDPKTGGVMAMVGRVSQDSETVFRAYNFATSAKRSPGSAIKPLVVYTPAIESGESMNTMINDEPVDYNGWKPENADKQWHGEIPLYQALANSYNIPAIKTLEKVGINTAVAKGREFGLDLKTGAGLSLALGSGVETNPWQMAQAYSAFANNGVMIESHLIRKIVDATGKTIATAKPSESRVMDKKTADTMTSMMLGTFSNGTGVYANPYNGYTMAGKTGTNENVDQWVMGYTPNVVMSTWVGFENPTKEGHQLQGTSSGTASSIFKTAARYMLPGTENTPFDVENAYYTNGIAPSSDTTTDSSQTAADDALKNVQDKATDWWNDFKGTTKETVKEKGKGIWDTIKGWFQRTSFSFAK